MNSAWEKNKGIDAYISDLGIAHFVDNHFLKIHIKTKVVDHLVKHNYGISAFLPLNKTKSVMYFGPFLAMSQKAYGWAPEVLDERMDCGWAPEV
jgi:hypothetical protein